MDDEGLMMIRGTTNDGRTPSRKRCRGNLRPAPFAITPSVVARVLALALAARPVARVVVPLSPVKLVDRPRRSQDPRLAKVNDDQAEQSSFSRLPLQEYGRKRMADGGGVSLNPQALVDRGEAPPHPIQRSTTTDSLTADHAGGCEGQAAEVKSGAVAGGRLIPPANARQPHNTANLTLPPRRTGKSYAQEIARLADELEGQTVIAITRCPGKPNPHLKIIRAAAEALRVKAEAKIDWARVAAAHAARPGPQAQPVAPPLEPAPNREECPRCGIPGWKGCAHFLPCEETFVRPNSAEDWRKGGQGKSEKIRFTGKRQGIGVLPI